jgi:hypothetical protein
MTAQDSSIYENAMRIYKSDNFEGASNELANYIKRFGNDGYFVIPANFYKAECDFYTDKENQALSHYAYVVNQGRNEFTEKSLIKLSSTYFYRKNYTKALENYIQLEPISSSKSTFISSIMGQVRSHYLLNNYDGAKQKAIQLLPIENVPKENLVEANMVLGRIQLKDSNLRTAKSHFDYVITESRNELTAEAIYHRASILYSQTELGKARKDIYTLNEDFSAYEYWVVKGFILLSDIYVKEEDYFQAKATLQSIMDNYNDEKDGLLNTCRTKLKEIEQLEELDSTPKIEDE